MDRREFLKKSMLLTAGAMVGGSLFPEATLSAAQSGSAAGKKKRSGSSSIRSGAIWAKTPPDR